MTKEKIKIRGQPTTSAQVCKFVVGGRPIIKLGDAAYFRKGLAGKSILPRELFKLGYLTKIGIEGDTLVLTSDMKDIEKNGLLSWDVEEITEEWGLGEEPKRIDTTPKEEFEI